MYLSFSLPLSHSCPFHTCIYCFLGKECCLTAV
uniref:Uncharacterized protein n=1 Tax=Anguilla anguilla TaxID=7936 RepID=A0A0E9U8H0_ANGAN